MLKKFKKYILILIFFGINLFGAPQNINLFEPYDWLFDPVRFGFFPSNDDYGFSFGLRTENSINTNGYLSNDSNCSYGLNNKSCFSNKVNPVQFLELKENVFASFLGSIPGTTYNAFSQQYSFYEGMTANDQVNLTGDFFIGNVVGTFEKWLNKTIRLGWYIPIYYMNLKNLQICMSNEKIYFEEYIENNILDVFNRFNRNVRPYNLYGFGDSSLLISWQDNFFENRDFLTGILCSLRAGLNLPTGQKKDISEQTLLKIPLGYDAAWGIIFGGSIEIDIGRYFGAGISADVISLFGKTCCRYIKTDRSQTDLLLLTSPMTFIDPGFRETFTILFNFHNLKKNYLCTLAYQYNKQNENDIVVCSEVYPTLVAATMERLGAWTAHNLTLLLQGIFEFKGHPLTAGIFGKLGFNGERVIAANTWGVQFEFLF